MALSTLEVQSRDPKLDSNARLRRAKRVPAVIHRKGQASVPVSLEYSRLLRVNLRELEILKVEVKDGKGDTVAFPKEVQTHPVTHQALHVIFEEVQKGQEMTADVKVRTIYNEKSPWVKEEGILKQNLDKVRVSFLPKDLISSLEVDLSDKEIGDSISVEELAARYPNLSFQDHPSTEVLSIVAKKAHVEEESEEQGESAAEEGSEPSEQTDSNETEEKPE